MRPRRSWRCASSTPGGRGQLPTVVTGNSGSGFTGPAARRSKKRSAATASASGRETRSCARAARPSALRGPSSRGARVVVAHREQRLEPAPLRGLVRDLARTVKTQWSKRSVEARTANSLGIDRPVARPRLPVQIEHRAGRPPRRAARHSERLQLAADVVAVLADQHVEAPDRDVAAAARARSPAAGPSGISVACGESHRADAPPCGRAGRSRSRTGPSFRATRCETRSRSVSRMAMARHAAAGSALRVEPGQRRVPGDVDRAVEQRRHLQLVGAVERHVDRAAAAPRRSRG